MKTKGDSDGRDQLDLTIKHRNRYVHREAPEWSNCEGCILYQMANESLLEELRERLKKVPKAPEGTNYKLQLDQEKHIEDASEGKISDLFPLSGVAPAEEPTRLTCTLTGKLTGSPETLKAVSRALLSQPCLLAAMG